MNVKYTTESAEGIAKALSKAGWNANVAMGSDGVPVLYVRGSCFEKLLLEAVDEGLSSLDGSPKEVVYSLLEKRFSISRRDIPYKIEEFCEAIETIFGLGAKVLQILIMRRLKEKVGRIVEYPYEREELVLTDYVVAARQSFLKNRFRHESKRAHPR